MHMRKIAVAFVGAALAVTMTGCVKNDSSAAGDGAAGSAKPIEVKIADDKCELSANTAPSGTIKFSLSNEGPARNEFEVLAKDKLQIMGAMENLAAGDKRDFTVQLEEGTYYTACKKNMVGSLVGLKEFKVTKGEGVKISADDKKLHDEAVTKYTAYVKDQAGQLVSATQEFVDATKRAITKRQRSCIRWHVCTTNALSRLPSLSAIWIRSWMSAKLTTSKLMMLTGGNGPVGTA